jgi:hypothetical protein
MKPQVYQVSWWPRADGSETPKNVKHKHFLKESEAALFHDGISAAHYWTRMGKAEDQPNG